MIKLLYILPELYLTNGITSYVMNHYERLDHTKFSVDFLIAKGADKKYLDIIEGNQDKIIQTPKINDAHYKQFRKHAKEVFSTTKYDIVHSHDFNWGMPYLREAKKQGVKVRIFHAHSMKGSEKFFKRVRNDIFIPRTVRAANELFACSSIAGHKFFKKKPFYLAHNAINKALFLYSEKLRKEIKEELAIDSSKKVIGYFGRFNERKNTLFLLSIMKEIIKTRTDIHLLLIGHGALQEEIFRIVAEDNLEDYVSVLDPRDDIYRYYSVLDLFILPSLYEGLPVVGVEALFNGVPQLYSNNITKEINLLNTITYLNIHDDINVWVTEVLKLVDKKVNRKEVDLSKLVNYDIEKQAKVLENKYIELVNK
ncbi:glycosyltransferase [Acholeplasma hippikon]|uniref:Lipopolysaccharide 1,2-N-acetylglucosaminetransferase n=1 Tax=Acholeplasma hippikon TaxID=264636 RepID=A0A449BLI7_9MOLU|nr:glycosyltransferase [Acholeplasma hippikon]VEU83298.1 lipopolysaccharide 1,2-N-acetylglucosaminetransferase [Acholeplasma hippikon]